MKRLAAAAILLVSILFVPILALADDRHPFQFPNTEYAYYEDGCWFKVDHSGYAEGGDSEKSDGYFIAYVDELSNFVNTSSMIKGEQKGYIYLGFYKNADDELIWIGRVPLSSVKYNANALRAVVNIKINDASLQEKVGDKYEEIKSILLNAGIKSGKNWIGKCMAPKK